MLKAKKLLTPMEGDWYQVDIGTVAITVLRYYRTAWFVRIIWNTETMSPFTGDRYRFLEDTTGSLPKALHALEQFWIGLTREENPKPQDIFGDIHMYGKTPDLCLVRRTLNIELSWQCGSWRNQVDIGYPSEEIGNLEQTALEVYHKLRRAYLSTVEQ